MRELPTGWRWVQLGELAPEGGKYGSGEAAKEYDPSLPRYVRITDIADGRLSEASLASISEVHAAPYLLKRNDLLFARSGATVGKTYLYRESDGTCAHAGYVIKFTIDDLRAMPEYLAHWTQGRDYWRWVNRTLRQGAQPNINATEYGRLSIPLPPLAEQRRITDILDTVDAYIDVSSDLVTKLLSLSTDLLGHLFSEKGWPTVRLGEICKITSGTTPLRAEGERYFAPKGIPWVKTLDLNEGTIVDTDEKVTLEAVRDLRLRILLPGTVLVAMYGGWEQIGRTALLGVSATTNQAICALEASGGLLPEFLLRALQQKRSQWRKVAASTRKDPNITKHDVHEFQVPMPPVQDQERIIKSYASHLERITNELRSKNRLEIFKRGMMEDLLTGRVRISQAEAVLEDL
jgi:type I restriction enzyme S subunit